MSEQPAGNSLTPLALRQESRWTPEVLPAARLSAVRAALRGWAHHDSTGDARFSRRPPRGAALRVTREWRADISGPSSHTRG
jgi:hypothetical protein